jgi:hypothetical protein
MHGSEMSGLRRIAALSLLVVMSSPLIAPDASADGMTYGYYPNTSHWSYIFENAQLAIINFDGSYEDLMLQAFVSSEDLSESSKALWIYPIPSGPQGAVIGIYDTFPFFDGHFLGEYARSSMTEDFALMYSSQIYTIPFALASVYTINEPAFGSRRALGPGGEQTGSMPGIDVFQRINQYGLSAELIGTSDSGALDAYVASLGASLPSDSIGIIQEYVDDGYSFVVSWISNVDDYISNISLSGDSNSLGYGLSVQVSFPTDSVYYPMRLTSVYGSEHVPIVLEIVGCVEPELDDAAISNLNLETYYCIDPEYEIGPKLETFFPNLVESRDFRDGAVSNLVFTLVLAGTEAQNMTYDLWFQQYDSPEVQRATFVLDHGWELLILIFIGASILSSLLSGWVIYRKDGPSKSKFALLGLANATTIVGFALITRHLSIDSTFASSQERGASLRWRRFVVMFSLVFLVLVFACHIIINSVIL